MYKSVALSGCQCEAGGTLWAGPDRDPSSLLTWCARGRVSCRTGMLLEAELTGRSTVNVFLQNGSGLLSLKVVCPWKDDSK